MSALAEQALKGGRPGCAASGGSIEGAARSPGAGKKIFRARVANTVVDLWLIYI
jgi:hypothetical protein